MTDISSIDLSLSNIWRAWASFRKGKKPSREIVTFESALERNLLRLCNDFNNRQYQHGSYSHRIVNEKKRRDIAVATVKDRVVHRLLYDYIVPIVDKRFDFDVWSCRKGKGLMSALERTQKLLAKYPESWVWRADVHKFFDNVDQAILQSILKRTITDPKALYLLEEIIASYNCLQNRTEQNRHTYWQFDQPDFC